MLCWLRSLFGGPFEPSDPHPLTFVGSCLKSLIKIQWPSELNSTVKGAPYAPHATNFIPFFTACGVSIDKVGSEAELDSGTEDSQDLPNTGPVDADGDGLTSDEDCDDTDASMPAEDADCDGALTVEDCDDMDTRP